jgi:transcriptional regulator with XRE-family HTH domain
MTRSYASNLRKGRIENPGFEKLRAIAKAITLAHRRIISACMSIAL